MLLKILDQPNYKQQYKKVHRSFENGYDKAIAALNSLQTNKNSLKDPELMKQPIKNKTRVIECLSKCGLELANIEKKLSVIHVSGTKGKGSTCAYCESILRHQGFKTGFFSSPHLVSVRERIRINGRQITKKKFSFYFWEVYKTLRNDHSIKCGVQPMPTYFMFLTLLAFKVFIEENVDVAILEVGIGGEYDCTNILRNTAVVGISSLGFDHTKILGNSIEEIAWQKAGILKNGCIFITAAQQPKEAIEILQQRASEKQCKIFVAPPLCEYPGFEQIKLGINGPVQELNASLAIQLANAWMNPNYYSGTAGILQKAPIFSVTEKVADSLETCRWLGRTQVLSYSSHITYYLDGAHTKESIQWTTEWFSSLISIKCKKVLIFNVIGNRNAEALLNLLIPCQFDYVIFSSNRLKDSIDRNDNASDNWTPFDQLAEENQQVTENHRIWLEICPSFDKTNAVVLSSVTEAHEFVTSLAEQKNHLQVLVTGSLHLVGAVLNVIDPQLECERI